MRRVARLLFVLAALAWAVPGPASAAPIFNVLPSSDIVAVPGETVGWGYDIVNDSDLWLVFMSLATDSFQHGSATDIFDYPIVAPGTSVTQPYVTGLGLLAFAWDVTAPSGWVNSGMLLLSADLYSDDPFEGGVPVSSIEFSSSYSTSIEAAAPAPEPATLLLLASGIVAVAGARRTRRRTTNRPL